MRVASVTPRTRERPVAQGLRAGRPPAKRQKVSSKPEDDRTAVIRNLQPAANSSVKLEDVPELPLPTKIEPTACSPLLATPGATCFPI
jgi:hypothetical protein